MVDRAHIVEIYFDIDRPKYRLSQTWVEKRHAIFHGYTLKSLKNQDIQDFEILLHLGSRHAEFTRTLRWDPRVTIDYDLGETYWSALEADEALITRLDSDDMIRRDGLATVRDYTAKFKHHRIFAFKDNICWDKPNRLIIPHRRASTPFTSRVWSRAIFSDWRTFAAHHLKAHGSAGLGDRDPRCIDLPAGRICIFKHGLNTNMIKRGKEHPVFTEAQRQRMTAYHDDGKIWPFAWKILDQDKIAQILSRFGLEGADLV